ncbi:MAG: hypothetical protein ACI9LM_001380 [Alteromonadaceae bacterium]|jgi:hypothetical protein
MKIAHLILSFLRWYVEGLRKPSINSFAKLILVWSLTSLAALSANIVIPTKWGDIPLTLGGGNVEFCIGLIVTSLLMVFYTEYQDRKEADDSQLIKIRHMGLIDHSIDDVQNYMPKKLKRIKPQPFDVEFDNSHKTINIDELHEQLNQICRIPQTIKDSGRSLSNGKKYVVYGGVAPVPMLAAAGHLVSNMQNVHVADWDRQNKKWHFNEQLDDGEKLIFENMNKRANDATSVNIAVSLSLPLRLNNIDEEFPDGALFKVTFESGYYGYDKICSGEKQERLVKNILEFINNEIIPNYPNLEKVDFFVAAQASFVFRLGSVLNQGHLPKIVFHHFNPDHEVKTHPWGIAFNGTVNGYEVVK